MSVKLPFSTYVIRSKPSSLIELTLRYTVFAIIAMFLNLAAQRAVLWVEDSPRGLTAAIVAGMGVGLVVKYLLDKYWIFADTSSGLSQHTQKFTLYTLSGVGTTIISCGSEVGFWLIYGTHFMREIGALIGLSTGYAMKYNLDKRFVFRESRQ